MSPDTVTLVIAVLGSGFVGSLLTFLSSRSALHLQRRQVEEAVWTRLNDDLLERIEGMGKLITFQEECLGRYSARFEALEASLEATRAELETAKMALISTRRELEDTNRRLEATQQDLETTIRERDTFACESESLSRRLDELEGRPVAETFKEHKARRGTQR